MTKEQVDTLLETINSLVDNAQEWTPRQAQDCAREIQRMAANLPRLVRERDEILASLRDVAPGTARRFA